ncbi:MAG: glycosyltransferase family 4 protein [Ignavibacteria bacterium]|nr:glycosyltransferase family 4 protein [Ignavibacteria bacterium]
MKLVYPALASDPTNPIRAKKMIVDYLLTEFYKNETQIEIAYFNNQFLKYLFAYKKILYQHLLKRNYLLMYDKSVLGFSMKVINRKINNSDADFVFCFGSIIPGYLSTSKPLFLIIDATFQNLLDYYFHHTNFPTSYIEHNIKIEQNAFQSSSKIFVSSEWAKNSLTQFYNISEEKIEFTHLGANIDFFPSQKEVERIIENKLFAPLKLTSIGKLWFQKGLDISIEIFSRIKKHIPNCSLTIIGCRPPNKINLEGLQIIEYIDKTSQAGQNLFSSILSSTHFFLFPSRAEAYGHVVPEANAFGVPVVANATGGIPSAVTNGQNGFLFHLTDESGISNAVDKILELYENKQDYYNLCKNSYDLFVTTMNWSIIAKKIINSIQVCLNSEKP